jgi:HPt (histidine-containing phosphotransfer) domain-containing protein
MREHPPEFEVVEHLRELGHVVAHRLDGRVVAVGARELEEFAAVAEAAIEVGERGDDALERLLRLAERLRLLRIVPDRGVLERAARLLEFLRLQVVVKDTSASRTTAGRGRRAWRRSGSAVRRPSTDVTICARKSLSRLKFGAAPRVGARSPDAAGGPVAVA